MQALADRDPEAARQAIRSHINKQEASVAKTIREQEK